MSKVYGLTGGIGSGKSTFARMLEELGGIVIDADQIARKVVEPGSVGLKQLSEAFGPAILQDDGTLNREALGELAFGDPELRAQLNQIVHPLIAAESGRQMMSALASSKGPVFYEAALLVENDAYQQFAGLIVVTASRENQIARVMERNALTEAQAIARIDAQLPLEEKAAVADYVIDNDGNLEALREKAASLMTRLSTD